MKSMLPDLTDKSGVQVHSEPPGSLLQVIANAVTDPRMDVAKMQALFDLQRQIMAEQRKIEFDEAMTRLQKQIPHIPKHGQGKNSRFAKYDDMDVIIRPMYTAEEFSLSFNEESRTDNKITFALEVSRKGHSKFYRLTVSSDTAALNKFDKAVRPAIQDDGSTASYARRYLIKLAFNIIEKDEDTDGESLTPISEDQVRDLEIQLKDTKSDTAGFLRFMGYDKLSEIRVKDLKKAQTAIDEKRRGRR